MCFVAERDITRGFMARLYERAPKDQWLTLFSLDATRRPIVKWHRVGALDAFVDEAQALGAKGDVWYGVATRKEMLQVGRGGAEDCALIPAIWVDIDVQGPGHKSSLLPPDLDAGYALLSEFPTKPDMVVRTGGGLQPYWILETPHPVDAQLEAFLADWHQTWKDLSAAHGWAIDNVFDAPRVLRCPGTHNRKREPVLVTVDGLSTNPSIEDLL
jgi:hypothetical protein